MSIISRSVAVALTALVVLAGSAQVALAGAVLTRSCTHEADGRVIAGSLALTTAGASGRTTIVLSGIPIDSPGTTSTIQTFGPITLQAGIGEYPYRFANVDPIGFGSYVISADVDGARVTESIDIEAECIPPGVPETPSTLLMVVSGLAVALTVLALQHRRAVVGDLR